MIHSGIGSCRKLATSPFKDQFKDRVVQPITHANAKHKYLYYKWFYYNYVFGLTRKIGFECDISVSNRGSIINVLLGDT